ncbi:hypothetical protein [Pseudomonas arcuscaelestis]|uniref:hypothetical protein n=1 Tax=Pseudomonas arcuscaelestis TaxID=2710591 RepID=UPI00193DFD72|nr:hypothetical protein [Pseudomonas arcuscaelestis]MBM3113151.1 hypothetical protein [Pseudomonas arcuscaelestis]
MKAGAPDQIPGYATHMEGVAKAAKYLKYGGWLGTSVGGSASYMKVQDIYAGESTDACKKVKLTEPGGVAGGAIAGFALTGSTTATICVALGVPSGGLATLAFGILVVGTGSFASGAIGGILGEEIGEVVYETSK